MIHIPRLLHHIWLGGTPMPAEFVAYRKSWMEKHPGWQFTLWTDQELPSMQNRATFAAAEHPVERSDILRLEVLHQFGGLYVDTDFECLQNVEPLLADKRCVLARMTDKPMTTGFMACGPGEPFFGRCLAELASHVAANSSSNLYWKTGPGYINRFVPEFDYLTILPPHLVYPYEPRTPKAKSLWKERGAAAFPEAYAAHHWAGSWRRRANPYAELRGPSFRPIKCLMAENQRQNILKSIPKSGSMLEYGSGGTTIWLADRMSESQRLVSVEHNAAWAARIRDANVVHDNYTMRHIPPAVAAEVGRWATSWEECPTGLCAYINQPDLECYDVFLVDGVARGACLMRIFATAKPGARVFLHDANRSWYDWALHSPRLRDAGVLRATPGGYPPDLWYCTVA